MCVWLDAVEDELLARRFNRRGRDVHAGNTGFAIAKSSINGETARIAETVQYAISASRVFAQGFAFITLIEKKACLLPLPRVHQEQYAIFAHSYLRGYATVDNTWLLYFQPLAPARLTIIAHQDSTRSYLFQQRIDNQRTQSLHTQRMNLDDQHLGKAVNDQSR